MGLQDISSQDMVDVEFQVIFNFFSGHLRKTLVVHVFISLVNSIDKCLILFFIILIHVSEASTGVKEVKLLMLR